VTATSRENFEALIPDCNVKTVFAFRRREIFAVKHVQMQIVFGKEAIQVTAGIIHTCDTALV